MTQEELIDDLKSEIRWEGKATLKSETVQLLLEDADFVETEEQYTEKICGEIGCYRNQNEEGDLEFARSRIHF